MFFVKTDAVENGTFSARLKSVGEGRVMVEVYATSGCVQRTPYFINYGYPESGSRYLNATVATASQIGLLGIASDTIASGCMGWVTVRGPVDNAAGPATSFTGSIGHSVYWLTAGVGCTGSAFHGLAHQVGFLLEETNSSTTANIFLVGNLNAQSL